MRDKTDQTTDVSDSVGFMPLESIGDDSLTGVDHGKVPILLREVMEGILSFLLFV
jgi:hypothetical protein